MAPKHKGKPAELSDNDNDKPAWDSSERNLTLYLIELKRWLPRQHSQLNNFIRWGYIINGKQEVVVHDTDHKEQLINGNATRGSFEKPFTRSPMLESDESDDDSYDAGVATRPLSSRKIRQPTPTTTEATPGLSDRADEQYRIAPKALLSFDEQVMETILDTFEDQDTAEDYREECQASARLLLTLLHRTGSSISTADDTNIETRQDALYKEGISTASVKDYNLFKSKYRAFNQARLVPKPNNQLATDYIQVVSRLGENIEARLESKLDFLHAHGNLKKTVDAIRIVLGKFEANLETNFLLHGKAAGAYLGRDPSKDKGPKKNAPKKEIPKKFDTSQPWKPADGPCPLKARGSGCDGKHWKKGCPNPNNVDTRPPQKWDQANPLEGKANLSVQEEKASAALFSGAAQTLDLSNIDSPAELLNALTDGESGRACMSRPAPLSEPEESADESSVSDSGTTVTTLSAAGSIHSTPKLFVVSLTDQSAPTKAHPGVYFGSWGPSDMLSEYFTDNEHIVSVDDLAQALEACEQFNAPPLFFGPRSLGTLKPGMKVPGGIKEPPPLASVPAPASPPARPPKVSDPVIQDTPRSTPTDGSWSGGRDADGNPRSWQDAVRDHENETKAKAQAAEHEKHAMFRAMLAEITPIQGLTSAPTETTAPANSDAFWRKLAITALSCCACSSAIVIAILVIILAFVLARERDPGAPPLVSYLIPSWGDYVPCIFCIFMLTVQGCLLGHRIALTLSRLVLRRLRPSLRHGMGAKTRPGSSPASPPANHSDARRKLWRATWQSCRTGSPPWITILLFAHWPIAILFEITSRFMRDQRSASPVEWLTDATDPDVTLSRGGAHGGNVPSDDTSKVDGSIAISGSAPARSCISPSS